MLVIGAVHSSVAPVGVVCVSPLKAKPDESSPAPPKEALAVDISVVSDQLVPFQISVLPTLVSPGVIPPNVNASV